MAFLAYPTSARQWNQFVSVFSLDAQRFSTDLAARSSFPIIPGSANLLPGSLEKFLVSLAICPKRAYRRNRYFARNELSRLCLGVFRTTASEPISVDTITGWALAAKAFDPADSILRTAIRNQVRDIVKRLHRCGEIERIKDGSSVQWRLRFVPEAKSASL